VIAATNSLMSGNTRSCGCLRALNGIKHGLTKHPLYRIWWGIKGRCYDTKNGGYCNYGGRGIVMCSEFNKDFKSFYDFLINIGWKKGITIDRIDNNGNYEPNNIRLSTPAQQGNNKRNNRLFEYNGNKMTILQLSKIAGITYGSMHARLVYRNYSVEQALKGCEHRLKTVKLRDDIDLSTGLRV